MRSRPARARLLLASVLVFQIAAGPSFAQASAEQRADPWEKFNRKMYAVEEVFDRVVFGPAARGYGKTPAGLRDALVNGTRNLGEPVVMVNDLLQGHIGQAASTLGRFAINTIFGLAGMIDVAKRGRIPHHDNTFGTTLARWGVGSGPYLFLPLVGPSTLRDAFGSAVDIGINPLDYVHYNGDVAVGVTTTLIGGLDTRVRAQTQLETIRQTSTDPYATIRSYFLQNRRAEVTGKEVDIQALPDFDEEPPATTPAPEGSVSPTPAAPITTPQPAGPAPAIPGEAGALPKPETAPPGPNAAPAPSPSPAPAPETPAAPPNP